MEIKNNRLEGEGIKHLKSPNTSGNIKQIKLGIIHDDSGASMAGTESWIMNPSAKVSYHVLIGKKGEVTQFVDFNKKAWHAGKSSWKGLNNINDYGIGVSMQNRNKEPYTEAQIAKAIEVCEVINRHYKIEEWTGHKNISPGRKTDPHDGFPWGKFRDGIQNQSNLDAAKSTKKVTASVLNMRSGPGTNFSVVEQLSSGTDVHVLSESNGWLEVLVCKSNKQGWVSSKYLK